MHKNVAHATHKRCALQRRRPDLPDAACLVSSAVCPGALGLGSPPAGYMGRAGGVVVDTSRRKNSKKAFLLSTHPLFSAQIAHPPIVNLKNFPQKQKDPYKGSVFCAILALQALKGRNLQKCTPYLE